jgi:hypothetical protein
VTEREALWVGAVYPLRPSKTRYAGFGREQVARCERCHGVGDFDALANALRTFSRPNFSADGDANWRGKAAIVAKLGRQRV